jgi:exo-1,4-beta-D-glucosaminidase
MLPLARLLILTQTVVAVENFVIPGWDLQSTIKAGNDLTKLSSPGYDSSSWYSVSARSTVFAGLIESGVYDTEQLFYSKNLQDTVDYLPYYSPWLYRSTFALKPEQGSHFFVQTNGITSKADIYVNGKEVANKHTQAGAYGGHTYDITDIAEASNAMVIRAYPTFYDLDFALGWVDWNSYPPDNGTGVWRDVSVKQTGSLYMGPLRIVNDYTPGASSVKVTLKADITNLEDASISGVFEGAVSGQGCKLTGQPSQSFKLGAKETRTVSASTTIQNPEIWWPFHWGDQPLYTASVSVRSHSSSGSISDKAGPENFGIRHITSEVNEHNDTIFSVNGHPFQVLGGGYAPDLFLRWDEEKFEAQTRYVLDMGLNTIRLEGKEEQPELYATADRMGLMVMPGWECCGKCMSWQPAETMLICDQINGKRGRIMMRSPQSSGTKTTIILQTSPCATKLLCCRHIRVS